MQKTRKNEALLKAIRYVDVARVKMQLDNGADPNYLANEVLLKIHSQMPVLAIATENVFQASNYKSFEVSKAIEIVKILLKAGANVNDIYHEFGDKESTMTPWQASLLNGDYEVVELFLSYNADANYLCDDCLSPLAMALMSFHKNNKIIKILLDHHADLNYISPRYEYTAWLTSIFDNDIETIKLFLNAGADINYKNNDGVSPLSLAMGDGLSNFQKSIK